MSKSGKLLNRIVADNSGVSPVIGVILMVAVTVIIAAVIGSTALGLGDEISETPPKAQFDITYETDKGYTDNLDRTITTDVVIIEHTGGESVDPSNIEVTVNGDNAYAMGPTGVDPQDERRRTAANPFQTAGPDSTTELDAISAGDRTVLYMRAPLLTTNDPSGEYNTNVDTSADYVPDDATDFTFVDADPMNENALVATWNSDMLIGSAAYDDRPRLSEDEGIDTINPGDTVKITWESGSSSQLLLEETV